MSKCLSPEFVKMQARKFRSPKKEKEEENEVENILKKKYYEGESIKNEIQYKDSLVVNLLVSCVCEACRM